MESQDERHIRRAIELAATHSADGRHGPFGAVVVREARGDSPERVVAEGWNAVVDQHDPTAHAEIQAIRRAAEALGTHDLSGCVLYTSCEPCPMCLAAIYWSRVDRVVYAAGKEDAAAIGFDDAFFYEEITKPWPQRKLRSRTLSREEARRVMRAWFENPKRVPY